MKCEIIIPSNSRKINVNVLGGDNQNILTSIPEVNGQFVFFAPDEKVNIACYYEESVYWFDAIFKGIVTIQDIALYEFSIQNLSISENRRTEERINTFIPAIITNTKEMIFATILDISNSGMRIETKIPVYNKEINIRFEYNGQIHGARGTIIREQILENTYLYGLQIKK